MMPPAADTNLAGNLGVKDFVAMAETSPGLAEDRKSPNSVFGGSVQFLVTKSVSGLGPTWSLVHFKGPTDELENMRQQAGIEDFEEPAP